MSEGLTIYRGDAYLAFESDASHYADSPDEPVNVIKRLHKAPLEGLTQLDNTGEKRTRSLECWSPDKAANYSWGTDGTSSTTVYFNNHCSEKVSAKLHFATAELKCMTTNGDTQGKDEYDKRNLVAITKGC